MKKDNLYSRWLNNQLTEEEKAALKSSGDLDILEKIIRETDSWSLPAMKRDAFQLLSERIKEVKGRQETRVISIGRNQWMYGIAASLVLLVASYLLFFKPTVVRYESSAGQIRRITLPDQTEVILNGHSAVSYVKEDWEKNRQLELSGEAYFHVKKKGPFKVLFDQAEVSVLGTRFNILSGKDLATVKCYEGRVMVSSEQGKQYVLTAGKGIRLFRSGTPPDSIVVAEEQADWINGESVFQNAPLQEVINALIIQFNVEFDVKQTDLGRKYTGRFVHSDLETALKMVFSPMGIQYQIEDSGKKVLLK